MPNYFQDVLEVATLEEFTDVTVQFTHAMGFRTVGATAAYELSDGTTQFVNAHNNPESYREEYKDFTKSELCPVMGHIKRSSRPIVWGHQTYIDSGREKLWEEQAVHGYQAGIALALHLPGGMHFQFGVDLDQDLKLDEQKLNRTVADIQLFAVHAQEAACRLLIPTASSSSFLKLTPREIEALYWTLLGKTAWETGKIIGISERTAVFHVNNAMHKLSCSSKHQAATKAKDLGLFAEISRLKK